MTDHTKSAGEVKARNETERQAAYKLADSLLNKPFHDPDADQVMLARQFLRALEREDVLREQVKELREGLAAMVNAKALKAVRELVAGWNGEGKADGPYERHPSKVGAILPTNCGAIYELDEAMCRARDLMEKTNA